MSNEIITILATFSTVGFIIVLGLPAILSTAWTLIRLRKPKGIEILTDYSIRFMSMFSDKKIFLSFFGLGLVLIVTGLFCLSYYFFLEPIIIQLSFFLQITTMVISIILLSYIAVKTHFVSPEEILAVKDYAEAKPPEKPDLQ